MSAHPTKEPKRYTALIPDDSGIAREVVLASEWDRLQAENESYKSALAPFAAMHRKGSDPEEVACQRGTASDLTIITSADFEWAAAVLLAAAPQVAKEP